MDNIVKEGEQFMDGGNQGSQQGGGQQQDQQQGQQQQGGGAMKNFEHNTEDAYINQGMASSYYKQEPGADAVTEANQFLTKEGVPTAMDGAIDGAVDTEANKIEKDF